MKAVIQRVRKASVTVDNKLVGEIASGLVVLLGIGREDSEKSADQLLNKILSLRIFPDANGKMNRSLLEAGGEILVVSQFTLYADTRKGRRPSFTDAADPEKGNNLYQYFVAQCRKSPIKTSTGVFQAEMELSLINTGPVTIIMDTKELPAA
ncbi:MAG: D-tyrosyl-tRNA(Tyr) deacylase [Deltaproteobacteria bacterium RIFCSPHIGHO2_12_FULL_43_9]|nr:MAG: D-tyrosyl-tRNA(Tyr) deacylase [Deltaproteobacteria bacterium RIFCSPHIGHO2_12_FULL_43_9]